MKPDDFYIETERTIIRSYKIDDAAKMKDAIDSSIEHLLPFMKWAEHEPEPIEKKVERITKMRNDFTEKEDYTLGIFCKEKDILLGSTGLHNRVGEGAREIGYWIRANAINKGYATEISKALTTFAFEKLKLEKVEIRCDVRNEASMRIPQKLGFTHEYTFRTLEKLEDGSRTKHHVFTMFKEEWTQ